MPPMAAVYCYGLEVPATGDVTTPVAVSTELYRLLVPRHLRCLLQIFELESPYGAADRESA
jgi:hypothetical protein